MRHLISAMVFLLANACGEASLPGKAENSDNGGSTVEASADGALELKAPTKKPNDKATYLEISIGRCSSESPIAEAEGEEGILTGSVEPETDGTIASENGNPSDGTVASENGNPGDGGVASENGNPSDGTVASENGNPGNGGVASENSTPETVPPGNPSCDLISTETQKIGFDGTKVISFKSLKSGIYNIDVRLLDSDGNVIESGSAQARVVPGKTSFADVELSSVDANGALKVAIVRGSPEPTPEPVPAPVCDGCDAAKP